MENDIYQILGVVADVLPARGVQVQFALTHTLIQSLLIIMMVIIMMVILILIMMVMRVLYLCPKKGHRSREENVQKLKFFS